MLYLHDIFCGVRFGVAVSTSNGRTWLRESRLCKSLGASPARLNANAIRSTGVGSPGGQGAEAEQFALKLCRKEGRKP